MRTHYRLIKSDSESMRIGKSIISKAAKQEPLDSQDLLLKESRALEGYLVVRFESCAVPSSNPPGGSGCSSSVIAKTLYRSPIC